MGSAFRWVPQRFLAGTGVLGRDERSWRKSAPRGETPAEQGKSVGRLRIRHQLRFGRVPAAKSPGKNPERAGPKERYFLPSAFLPSGFLAAPAAPAAPSAPSSPSSFFFFFFFIDSLKTRTLGRPSGLSPSFQRSASCRRAWAMRGSARCGCGSNRGECQAFVHGHVRRSPSNYWLTPTGLAPGHYPSYGI